MNAALARDPLLPRSPDGTGPGVALSLLAHAALVAALAYGVNWRAPTPTVVSAELWAAVPQTAAPAAAEPPPAPPAPAPAPAPAPRETERAAPPPPRPQADIAVERSRREQAERQRAAQEERERQDRLARERAERERQEKERQARAAQDKARQEQARQEAARAKAAEERAAKAKAAEEKAEQERLAKLREDNLRRMMGQAEQAGTGAPGSRGSAAADAAPSAAYAGRLTAAIKSNLIFDWRGAGNPAAVVEVRAAPSGTIMGRTLVKSSGVKEWDEAILRAIDRTARLPADTDGRVPGTLTITFRPRD